MKKKKQKLGAIRVMLVDDHAGLRRALRELIDLQPDLEVVAEADSGTAALQLFPRTTPDVVLMDGSMPEMNGIETTRRLKQIRPKVKVVGLTLYSEATYLEEMVAAGASGYLLKTGEPANLASAIRIVNKGGTYFDSAIPRRAAAVAHKPSTQKLTTNELAVARMLANGQNNAEIADSLSLKIGAVERHRAAVLKKLRVCGRAGLIRLAAERHWLDD